jgi:hypothetical protein
MKKLSLLLAVLLLAAALYPLPVVAAPAGVSKITLIANAYTEQIRRVYTNARQIDMLLSYLPTEEQRISRVDPMTGGVSAGMRFMRGGVEEQWVFTANYALRILPDNSNRAYKTDPGTWRLLLAMAGYRSGSSDVAQGFTFQGETVREILLLNGAERMCSSFGGDPEKTKALLAALEPLEPSTTGGQIGAYVFTDKGRYAYYFNKDDPGKAAGLIREEEIEERYWHLFDWSPQWLSWIDPAQVTAISYTGGGEGSDGTPLSLKTANPQAITEIASYVKEVPVVPGSYSVAEEPLPLEKDFYRLELQFRSGMKMWVDGRTDTLTVGATGLSRELMYQVDAENNRVLREFFALQAAGISEK